MKEFTEKFSSLKNCKRDMPKAVMNKIINGIIKSRNIPPHVKEAVKASGKKN